jgi:sulfur-carrier protein adenylyltransferase/sulfurtransferase
MKMGKSFKKYQRQISLPGFGQAKQQQLFDAKILVIGAGGLGCPALLYLAAAGIGEIGIIDFDTVEESNLHRQILFEPKDIGKLKAEVAQQKLSEIFPDSKLISFPYLFEESNASELISNYDLVIDGSDNFTTRYLVDEVCRKLNKPWVYGSVSRFEGQVAVFNYPDKNGTKSLYTDLFPTPPKEGSILNCAEAGVIGVLPGIIGTMQANEAIKIITGLGTSLANKLLTYHSLFNRFYETNIGLNQSEIKGANTTENPSDLLNNLRTDLNELDVQLMQLLVKRNALVTKLAKPKIALNLGLVQPEQWKTSLEKRLLEAENLGISKEYIEQVFSLIHQESITEQKKIYDRK